MLNAQPTRRMLNVTETQSNRQAQKGVIMSINAGQNQKGKTRHNSHLMPPSIIYDNILFCIQFARFICLLSDSHFALLSQQVATTSRRKSLIKSGVLKKIQPIDCERCGWWDIHWAIFARFASFGFTNWSVFGLLCPDLSCFFMRYRTSILHLYGQFVIHM